MSNLLQIERNFLNLPDVSESLKLSEIRNIQRTIESGKRKRFEQSLTLSKHVNAAFDWFKSDIGQAKLREEGITWNVEDFSLKVFGWQKSYFYKMLKVSEVPQEIVEQYQQQEDSQRSVEELLKFTKQLESSEVEERPMRAEKVLTISINHPFGKVKISVDENNVMSIKGVQSEEEGKQVITDIINILNAQI